MVIQLTKFGIVGVAATLAHYSVALFSSMFISIYLSNILGYIFGIFVSYGGHRRFTFTSSLTHRVAFPRFLASSIFGLAVSYAPLYVTTSNGMPNWLSLIVAIGIMPIVNFAVMRFWVFRPGMSPAADS